MNIRNAFLIFSLGAVAVPGPLMGQGGDAGLFSGPNILSRGTGSLGRSGGRPIRLRANLTFGTAYYGGLTRAGLESDLRPGNESTYSGNIGFGVVGEQATPRRTTSGQYRGMLNLFGNQVTFTGLNQQGTFTHVQKLSRRWTAMVTGRGSTQSTVLTGLTPNLTDTSLFDDAAVALAEPFDTRVVQAIAGGGFSFQKSARMSFTMGGGAGLQRRKAQALVDSNVYQAFGDMSYQLSRRTGVGASYSFLNSFHKGNFGESYMHTAMGNIQRVLSPHWSFGAGLGVLRVEADRLQSVEVDPLITALTGQTRALQAFHSVYYGLAARATLSGLYGKSSMVFNYNRGGNAGNGFVLSGQMERVGGQYTYSGIRRTALSAFAMRVHYIPVLRAFDIPDFTTISTGTAMSYRLSGFLHLQGSAQVLRSETASGLQFQRDRYVLTIGLTFQPGEVPLVLW